jgi:hypothetical protein
MVKTYVVPMTTGTPIQLSTALSLTTTKHPQYQALWMQPRGTNTALIYIGSDNTVSSTNYGVRLEIPVSTIPQAPFNPGDFSSGRGYGNKSPIKLSDIWVLGTTGDNLHILALYY